MTKEKLLEIDAYLDGNDKDVNFDGWAYFDPTKEEPLEVMGVRIWSADHHGGSGQGDDFYEVIAVEEADETTFWKIPGYYQSNYGAELDFDDIFQVVEKEKLITVWVDAETGAE